MKKWFELVQRLSQPAVELLTRVTLGLVFTQSGWGKFQDLSKVISYFEHLKIPMAHVQAPFVAGVELIGGIFLLVGLFTEFASVPLIGVMGVAILTAKLEDLEGFSDLFGFEEFLYILLLFWLVSKGSRTLSLDVFCRKGKGSCHGERC